MFSHKGAAGDYRRNGYGQPRESDETATAASKAKVPIYSIGIGNPNARVGSFLTFTTTDREAVDTKALSKLANDTGGQTFLVTLADKGDALKRAATSIAAKSTASISLDSSATARLINCGSSPLSRKDLKLKVIPPG